MSFLYLFISGSVEGSLPDNTGHSVAREWNELLLQSIREDLARPTVHARNLWHTSVAMYDAWAVYDEHSKPYFLDNTIDGYFFEWNGVMMPADVEKAREEAISFAMYRILKHRFRRSKASINMFPLYDQYMASLGYNINFTGTDYSTGSPAAVGNYIAQEIIAFGLQDGSNEAGNYGNLFYEPINPPLIMDLPGNPDIIDLNRWQPLFLDVFIDQSGNPIPGNSPDFLSPEWGSVTPFALSSDDLTMYEREDHTYYVYHDPGPPPYLDENSNDEGSAFYKWAFELTAKWSSHLDSDDPTIWDISPASIGNVTHLPTTWEGMKEFYKDHEGGDRGKGFDLNPVTGKPYTPQLVKRGDYTRVLAEFWADGPDSETPPGHWFTLMNYVSDHPLLQKRFGGVGPVLNDLKWDVISYFILGGAMHDAAITAWGCKGWYDYVRPVSALRGMAELGQSTDPSAPSYNNSGLPLDPGFIELVYPGDPLAGNDDQHVGKIKFKAWLGPEYVNDPDTDQAGVGWVLAENWYPYQRPTFVTPPFAGYVSGHSTYSRAAAEVLTLLTGDPFFPGGMGEFVAAENEFLVFEEGPSTTITLQWATYRDASDQCSLSRIWGGIHPPVDDIPGRIMGREIGIDAFYHAQAYIFESGCPETIRLNEQPILERDYHAKDVIQAGGQITRNTSIAFKAGNSIILDNGFHVDQSGLLNMNIENCVIK